MEVHLIDEVAKWPILYDTSLEEYRHNELKNHAWRQITLNLFNSTNSFIGPSDPQEKHLENTDENVEKVKNKWKNLRDTFVKSQRKKEKPNSKPWKLESQMRFLIPHINPKVPVLNRERSNSPEERSSVSSPEQTVKENNAQPPPNIDIEWLNAYVTANNEAHQQRHDFLKIKREEEDLVLRGHDESMAMQHVETVMEDSPKVPSRKRRREGSDITQHFLDTSNAVPRLEQGPIQYDAVDCYFLGLAQTVKRLKSVNQVLIKKAVSNLIFDIELKELEGTDE